MIGLGMGACYGTMEVSLIVVLAITAISLPAVSLMPHRAPETHH